MKKLIPFVFCFALTGCSLFMGQAERDFLERKEALERKVELLRLEVRKAQLENKLMELDKDL